MKNKTKLPLSIIIPCADDARIKYCLDSIDEEVEVVVVLNGASKEVKQIVSEYNIKKVIVSERNLPKALNAGIENSKYKHVLFMDADCVFERGAIRKLLGGMGESYLAKGNVIFQRNNFTSEIIAKVREYLTSDPPRPYNPFLCMRKDIKKQIDNYYFDNDIHWTEDADLNVRVTRAGIKVKYVMSAKIFHPPLTMKYDLKSSFRYGIGKRIRIEKGIAKGLGSFFRNIPDVISKKGIFPGIYLFIWNCFYTAGFIYQIIGDPYNVRSLTLKQNEA